MCEAMQAYMVTYIWPAETRDSFQLVVTCTTCYYAMPSYCGKAVTAIRL